MVWRVSNVEDQRILFIDSYQEHEIPLAELCREFGISRKNAYKWIERFQNEGYAGLKDRSRARRTQLETPEDLLEKVLALKERYPFWGPKKILGYLSHHEPEKNWPSATTIGNILLRHGFQQTRQIKKRLPARESPLSHCN